MTPQTYNLYFCIILYQFVVLVYVTLNDWRNSFIVMCHGKINTQVSWVCEGCVSSQEAWLKCLQLLGKWFPLHCSRWFRSKAVQLPWRFYTQSSSCDHMLSMQHIIHSSSVVLHQTQASSGSWLSTFTQVLNKFILFVLSIPLNAGHLLVLDYFHSVYMLLFPPLTEAHFVFEVKSKTNHLIFHSLTYRLTALYSSVLFWLQTELLFSMWERSPVSPLLLNSSSTAQSQLSVFYGILIYRNLFSDGAHSHTQDTILLYNACKLTALLMLNTAQWTVEIFEPQLCALKHSWIFLFYYETEGMFYSLFPQEILNMCISAHWSLISIKLDKKRLKK